MSVTRVCVNDVDDLLQRLVDWLTGFFSCWQLLQHTFTWQWEGWRTQLLLVWVNIYVLVPVGQRFGETFKENLKCFFGVPKWLTCMFLNCIPAFELYFCSTYPSEVDRRIKERKQTRVMYWYRCTSNSGICCGIFLRVLATVASWSRLSQRLKTEGQRNMTVMSTGRFQFV